jgi:hypothetical protein
LKELIPQLFFAATDIVPPAFPEVAEIVFAVDEPTHPDGNTQV